MNAASSCHFKKNNRQCFLSTNTSTKTRYWNRSNTNADVRIQLSSIKLHIKTFVKVENNITFLTIFKNTVIFHENIYMEWFCYYYFQGWLHGCMARSITKSPALWRALCLVKRLAVIILKFLTSSLNSYFISGVQRDNKAHAFAEEIHAICMAHCSLPPH